MSWIAAAGLSVAATSAAIGAISRAKANKKLKRLQKEDPVYEKSQYPANQLSLAQQLYGGRMFGAADQEQNIAANTASLDSQIDRGSTDASQALALKAMAHAKAGEEYSDLGVKEKQNKYLMLQNLNNAIAGMNEEEFRVFQDKVRRFGNKVQIQGAQTANTANTWQSFSNLGMGMASLGGSMGGAGGSGGGWSSMAGAMAGGAGGRAGG